MKKWAVLALAACATFPALAVTSVGISIDVVQPGVYGRVDIGNVPPPPVVYTEPVVIVQPRYARVVPQPVYLYVPDYQQRQWGRYCGQYRACGQPVYFIREQWVREHWEHERHDRGRHGRGPDRGEGHGRGHGHGHDHDD